MHFHSSRKPSYQEFQLTPLNTLGIATISCLSFAGILYQVKYYFFSARGLYLNTIPLALLLLVIPFPPWATGECPVSVAWFLHDTCRCIVCAQGAKVRSTYRFEKAMQNEDMLKMFKPSTLLLITLASNPINYPRWYAFLFRRCKDLMSLTIISSLPDSPKNVMLNHQCLCS